MLMQRHDCTGPFASSSARLAAPAAGLWLLLACVSGAQAQVTITPPLDQAPIDQEVLPDPSPRPPVSALDAARPADRMAEYDMTSGRLTKLPVSWYLTKQVSLLGPHRVMFRTLCASADSDAGRCDTAMLVYGNGNTRYNDNDPSPAAHGTGSGKGSYITMPLATHSATYSVVVFSQLRATSRTYVEYSANGGASWARLSGSAAVEVGGTVVKVGPLLDGDAIEVQTRSNGGDDDATQMLLFGTDSSAPNPVPSDNVSGADGDPRIPIDTAGWTTPRNYVLIGKKTRSGASRAGVETRVDLVHHPLSVTESVSLTACNGGCGASLAPGRYALYVFATIDNPVGDYTSDPGSWHPSGEMPLLNPTPAWPPGTIDPSCPSDEYYGYGDATWYRGTPNDVAMTLRLQYWDGSVWRTLRSRKILRGAFGTAPGHGWNLFSLDLEVAVAGTYRIATVKHVPGVKQFEYWRYQRNPEATELKAVTYNTLYKSYAFDVNKYRNIANLLGTRGSIYRSSLRVEERPDQAPFQWEADVLGMQEVIKGPDGNGPGNEYTDVVRDELDARSSLTWTYAQGRGETWFTGWDDGPGMNPILLNSNVLPGRSPASAYFGLNAKKHASCDPVLLEFGGQLPDYYMECHLSEQGMGDGDEYNYATAAKLSAWRGGTEDRPLVVLNVHMEPSDGPKDFAPRVGELKSLIKVIDRLLEADHAAFNRADAAAGDKSSPLHHQNRILILGDWNIRAHECGEHYWMVRMLREHFGYAVDVSMASPDADLRQGMHVGAGGYGPDEVPLNYQHMSKSDPRDPPAWIGWRSAPDFSSASRFPWWASDWRDETTGAAKSGERLSAIMLVGKGWAYDDLVLGYTVMSDSNHVSPMNLYGRGVEMFRDPPPSFPLPEALACAQMGPGAVAGDAKGYAPSYSLGCDDSPYGGINAGAPALHSDHRPMGVRLRIWSR